MKKIELSKRLTCVANMLTKGGNVADIGCDHGFVSIYLKQMQAANHIVAMDVNEGPLARAKEHIEEQGLEAYIETRLSDGMQELRQEDHIDTAILAGMGGKLMERIIRNALDRGLVIPQLVLQPQSEWEAFRRFLRTNHYYIVKEDMILEDGKFYPVLKVRYQDFASQEEISFICPDQSGQKQDSKQTQLSDGQIKIQRILDTFGPYLVSQKHPVLRQYLDKEISKFEFILKSVPKQSEQSSIVHEKLKFLCDASEVFECAVKKS